MKKEDQIQTKEFEITEYQPKETKETSLFFDIELFNHTQRVAKIFTNASMVPEHFRNNLGNCLIALNYAHRIKMDPFMVMQKMYVIHGKPAIETQLAIALFNKSPRFSSLKYALTGEGDQRTCIAYSTDIDTNEKLEGPPINIKMAKDEGWYEKNGSKWKTLPELMLRYRAAAFFIRLYAPETTLGIYTVEEMNDSSFLAISNSPQAEIEQNANKEKLNIDEPLNSPQEMPQAIGAEVKANPLENATKEVRPPWEI